MKNTCFDNGIILKINLNLHGHVLKYKDFYIFNFVILCHGVTSFLEILIHLTIKHALEIFILLREMLE